MEHRWGRRVVAGVKVRLDAGPGVLAVGRLRNASLSGGYLEGVPPLPVMACVHVELEWGSHTSQETGRVRAYVVRTDAGGLGLEWAEFAPEGIRALIAARDHPPAARSSHDVPASVSPSLSSHGVSRTQWYSSLPPTGVLQVHHCERRELSTQLSVRAS